MVRRPSGWLLLAAAGLVLGLVLAETAYMFWSDYHLQKAARRLESTVLPRVSHAVAVRSNLVALAVCIGMPRATAAQVSACADARWERIHGDLKKYAELSTLPRQSKHLEHVEEAMNAAERRLRALDEASKQSPAAFDAAVTALLGSLGDINDALNELAQEGARNLTSHTSEISSRRRDSEIVELSLDALAVVVAMISTVLAVRSMRRYNRFLEAKALELERFSSTIAHDVLGPLSTVGLTMPVIKKRHPGDDQTQRLAEIALRGVRQVRLLVDGLLTFARAGAQPGGGTADVAASLGEAVNGVRAEAEEARVEVVVEDAAGFVACSGGVLFSILSNLLQNAIKFMGDRDERRVTLRALALVGRVRFEVEDTGPGVPAHLRDAIFEPYFRLGGGERPGLGLGLATVKRLVLAHGGKLGVSESAGGGAIFWFEMPSAAGVTAHPAA